MPKRCARAEFGADAAPVDSPTEADATADDGATGVESGEAAQPSVRPRKLYRPTARDEKMVAAQVLLLLFVIWFAYRAFPFVREVLDGTLISARG